MNKLYDDLNSILALEQYLVSQGFKYGSDGMNAWEVTDDAERPTMVLARKFANCNGYMRLYEGFIKYKKTKGIKVADTYKQYEIVNGDRWHFINFIYLNHQCFFQSNIHITEDASEETTICNYKIAGWEVKRIVEEWKY